MKERALTPQQVAFLEQNTTDIYLPEHSFDLGQTKDRWSNAAQWASETLEQLQRQHEEADEAKAADEGDAHQ